MVYASQAMEQVHQMAIKVADTESNVLILGENGTGKGVLAAEIHKHSARSKGPFVQIDLGALSESLFEAELFGHAKGAFTDAQIEKKGRIEEADGGTLFLDEIGNLPLNLQSKMLTVVQSKKIVRIGETQERSVDFRLITATNMPLQQMMEFKDGSLPAFRSDLFFRINTVQVEVPPLRKRPEDIAPLAAYFISKLSHNKKIANYTLSEEAITQLKKHTWPGNIRELSHVIEQAMIFCDDSLILAKDLNLPNQKANTNSTVHAHNMNLEEIEKQAILQLLKKHNGNMTKVAKELGIGRTTLYRKIEKYGI
jgi:transcriptional regulator with PAS, ATPase and Fis domain